MICEKCGESNPDDSKFCMQCGTTLTNNANSTTASVSPPGGQLSAQDSNTWKWSAIDEENENETKVSSRRPISDLASMSSGTRAIANSPGVSTYVVVTDINMTFGSMVVFMIKWALAAIPALMVLLFIFFIISTILGGVLGGLLFF